MNINDLIFEYTKTKDSNIKAKIESYMLQKIYHEPATTNVKERI